MTARNFLWNMGRGVRRVGDFFHNTADALQLKPLSVKPNGPSLRRVVNIGERRAIINQGAWIAPTANIIGSVQLGINSTVWYGAVLRGDIHAIKIGILSHIGDRSVIHVSGGNQASPRGTYVGNNVIIEPGVILHACVIEDGVKIGSGSVIFDGAVVEKNAQVSSGSVVTQGKTVPSGELWAGSPAKFVRKLEDTEIQAVQETSENFFNLAKIHDAETQKTELEIAQEREHFIASKDVWWGEAAQKTGNAKEHPNVARYIQKNREQVSST